MFTFPTSGSSIFWQYSHFIIIPEILWWQTSGIQASRILIQLAKTSDTIYRFYKGIEKQICDVRMFHPSCGRYLSALAALLIILPHADAIIVETSSVCDHIIVCVPRSSPINAPGNGGVYCIFLSCIHVWICFLFVCWVIPYLTQVKNRKAFSILDS
jgi:hypothetical protein